MEWRWSGGGADLPAGEPAGADLGATSVELLARAWTAALNSLVQGEFLHPGKDEEYIRDAMELPAAASGEG